MSTLEKIKRVGTLSELAALLGYKPSKMAYIIYQIPEDQKYQTFTIPKSSGGTRLISAPEPRLKKLQQHLCTILDRCYNEICNEYKYGQSLSHGFRKGHTILSNATLHKNRRYVFNVDLENFFPSINFGRVRGYFIKDKNFLLPDKIATIIAQIACHENVLPQGSPCSPVISNLIGHILDIRLVNLAKTSKCTYSRYADDITFSTNKADFPDAIGYKVDGNLWSPGRHLLRLINKCGFSINNNKISMQYKTSRQMVTGLVVNKKPNTRTEYFKYLKAMCNSLFNTGKCYDYRSSGEISLNQLGGMLNYVYSIKRLHDSRDLGARHHHPKPIARLYRGYIFYKYFFAQDKPIIICEGKTDVIHLKCAIKALRTTFPKLVDAEDKVLVKIIDFTANTRDVLGLASGTSGLHRFATMYGDYMKRFNVKGSGVPVIILIDNDGGAREIFKQNKITEARRDEPFFYIQNNLYIVATPRPSKTDTNIESFYDKATLATEINGKSFNPADDIDTKSEYGKIVFAHQVVNANRAKIDFTGFNNLLSRLATAIEDYGGRPRE